MNQRPGEFWQQDLADTRLQLRKFAWRVALLFFILLTAMGLVLWRTTAAVDFAAARMQGTAQAQYRVFGKVLDTHTGKPVPWPVLADDTSHPGPHFHTTGKADGTFELWTLSIPHTVRVTAYGYRPSSIQVGRTWWLWTPAGEQQAQVSLTPEERPATN